MAYYGTWGTVSTQPSADLGAQKRTPQKPGTPVRRQYLGWQSLHLDHTLPATLASAMARAAARYRRAVQASRGDLPAVGAKARCAGGSVYGQGAQHRFLGPMCCVKPAAYSTSRAHICGAGEAGLDRRVKPPPHVALTPRHGPQNYGSAEVSKKTIPVPSRNGGARRDVASGHPDSGRRWRACR